MTFNNKLYKSIKEYLIYCREENICHGFKGPKIYHQLLKEKFIEPYISYIRINYNTARFDEHYQVIEEGKLEGVILACHSGKEGVYNPEEIIEKEQKWEILPPINPALLRD